LKDKKREKSKWRKKKRKNFLGKFIKDFLNILDKDGNLH